MIRVAIETATRLGSVAVARDDRLLAEVTLGVQTRHAEGVLPALDAALRLADVDRAGIRAVVVGAGPGSFTGVRVAGATAKGLATALDVPLLAYSSLLALAVDAAAGAPAVPLCGLFDARRGEVYAGCWRVGGPGGALAELMPPRVGAVEQVVADLAERLGAPAAGDAGSSPRAVMTGEGAVRYRAALEDALAARGLAGVVAMLPGRPRASGLLWLAHHHPDPGRVPAPSEWEPLYVRGSSAERGVPG